MEVSNNTALLVIDVQQGLFQKSTPLYKAGELLEKINSLVDRAHQAGVAVFYIQHSDKLALIKGSPEWQFHKQLQPLRHDFIVHKQHGNAFEETKLDEMLKSRDITNLVVTGLVTHGCVKATCLGARKLGYQVTLVKDAHSSYSQKAAQLIEEWHTKLAQESVALTSAADINFS